MFCMSVVKKQKQAVKAVAHQQRLLSELDALVKSVERCEKTTIELKTEMEAVNSKHQNRKTTEEDIAFLTDLLKCANKKLGWEKQIASLKKKTPIMLQEMVEILNDAENPPEGQMRAAMLERLQTVQGALARLDRVKTA